MKWVKVILILCLAILSVSIGYLANDKEPVKVIEKIEVIKEVPVVKEAPIVKWHTITELAVVTKEIPRSLKYFANVEELKVWLEQDDTDSQIIVTADANGFIQGKDCENYAMLLMERALNDGYYMSVQVDTKCLHALNQTIISNRFYFIEPQTDEFWVEAYLD